METNSQYQPLNVHPQGNGQYSNHNCGSYPGNSRRSCTGLSPDDHYKKGVKYVPYGLGDALVHESSTDKHKDHGLIKDESGVILEVIFPDGVKPGTTLVVSYCDISMVVTPPREIKAGDNFFVSTAKPPISSGSTRCQRQPSFANKFCGIEIGRPIWWDPHATLWWKETDKEVEANSYPIVPAIRRVQTQPPPDAKINEGIPVFS
mmetsp:Transcript_19308/g.43997  ORF Transcript_19308/g.43997 Transcript_19308/m.43997 type:complete len:205 (-) Transcript_19308:116-730(-)